MKPAEIKAMQDQWSGSFTPSRAENKPWSDFINVSCYESLSSASYTDTVTCKTHPEWRHHGNGLGDLTDCAIRAHVLAEHPGVDVPPLQVWEQIELHPFTTPPSGPMSDELAEQWFGPSHQLVREAIDHVRATVHGPDWNLPYYSDDWVAVQKIAPPGWKDCYYTQVGNEFMQQHRLQFDIITYDVPKGFCVGGYERTITTGPRNHAFALINRGGSMFPPIVEQSYIDAHLCRHVITDEQFAVLVAPFNYWWHPPVEQKIQRQVVSRWARLRHRLWRWGWL